MRTATDGEVYYNPHIQTHITDASLAAGLKGNTGKDWNWDVSNTRAIMIFIIMVTKHLMLHLLVSQPLIILMMVVLIFCKIHSTLISVNQLGRWHKDLI